MYPARGQDVNGGDEQQLTRANDDWGSHWSVDDGGDGEWAGEIALTSDDGDKTIRVEVRRITNR